MKLIHANEVFKGSGSLGLGGGGHWKWCVASPLNTGTLPKLWQERKKGSGKDWERWTRTEREKEKDKERERETGWVGE